MYNQTNMFNELNNTATKLTNSYTAFKNLPEITLATTPKTQVYTDDKLTLYRFNRETPATTKTPVLIVYALVNTWQMMDLQPDRSYVTNLLNQGLDVYLIDWGTISQQDKYNTMNDYINGYVNNCVDYILGHHKLDKINLMGICQGGTFSTIYSAIHPQKVKNLITLVTPIDFSTNDGLLFKWAKDMDFDALVKNYNGIIPGSFLNVGFEMLKPMMKINKGQGLMNAINDEEKLLNFMRMEKWIADSPDQAGACYLQFMKDLYQSNKLINGELVIGKHIVNLKNITMPLLNIYATEDHLVPPSATIPLNDYVGTKDKEIYSFKGGHIGVFTGARSQKELAPTVGKWLMSRDK
jgi:polyhydroxyalkanoate synthase subunit PhaC